jgi:3,4-dehydroadipyl-CoA semialdehyde dehydrogenase
VVSFTGSAETAAVIRSHPPWRSASVRVNIEADSVNSALLLPGEAAGSEAFDLLAKEVAREMTVKSGQKCTAIRRVFVPEACTRGAGHQRAPGQDHRGQPAQRGGAHGRAGQPRAAEQRARRPGPSASNRPKCCTTARARPGGCRPGRGLLRGPHAAGHAHADADAPTACTTPKSSAPWPRWCPTATPPTRWPWCAAARARWWPRCMAATRRAGRPRAGLADSHGRVHVISPTWPQLHTGHGNVMPQSLHGGPGRAGGGEELGGLRALNFYHRRSAVQASTAVLAHIELGMRSAGRYINNQRLNKATGDPT